MASNFTAMNQSSDPQLGQEDTGYSFIESIVIAVVAVILSLLTILGNVLVMVSFKMDKQLQTISNYFLLSLAVADFFIGLISMPLYTMYLLSNNRWPLGPLICDSWLAFDYLNSNASVLNLLVISFDRYFSVTRPLTYRVRRTTRRACLMIASTWFISLLLWPPWIFAWPYIEGKRSVPDDQCYIQFLETNPYITFGTAIAAFYIPVTVMCILYWRIWRETEKRYKDLTTLFLVSAVGGRVRTAPGQNAINVVDDDTIADRFKSFLTWPINMFSGARKNETDVKIPASTPTSSMKAGRQRGEDPTSTTEDEDDTNSEATCGSSAGGTRGKRSALASDSIYTILITLGDASAKGTKYQTGTQVTPTTTSSATLTPVAESEYTINQGDSECHTIKQFFESAIAKDVSEEPRAVHSSSSSPSTRRQNNESLESKSKSGKLSGSNVATGYRELPGSGLRAHTGRSSASNSGKARSAVSQPKSEKKAAKTLSAILLTFIITWTPYNVLVLIKTLSSSDPDVIPEALWSFAYYLCYINSTINPFCYALCNVNFRNTYLRILKCQWTLNSTRQRAKDAQLDLPPAQSKKEKKKRNKKRNKLLASRLTQQKLLQQATGSSATVSTAPKTTLTATTASTSRGSTTTFVPKTQNTGQKKQQQKINF